MINHYHLAGVEITQVVEESAPSVGSEVCIDGMYYVVTRSIRHISMCPPWRTNVHLRVGPAGEAEPAASC